MLAKASNMGSSVYVPDDECQSITADSLRRKLIIAIAECARQVAAFKEINKSIPSETQAKWQNEINAFTADRSALNPYLLANKGTSSSGLVGQANRV
jgi:hypothetical protein